MKGQEQVWVDKDFKRKLKVIKAQMLVNGIEIKNLGQITKEILKSEKFDDIVKDIMKKNRFSIRMERRRIR